MKRHKKNDRVYVIYRGEVTRATIYSIMDELVAPYKVEPLYIILPKWDQSVGTMPDYLRLRPKEVFKRKRDADRAHFAVKLKNG